MILNRPNERQTSNRNSSRSTDKRSIKQEIENVRKRNGERRGVHSVAQMEVAGFKYTGDGDRTRCDHCGLEISDWSEDMRPFFIHAERQPTCSFVCKRTQIMTTTDSNQLNSKMDLGKKSPEDSGMELNYEKNFNFTLNELESLIRARERSFSHWIHQTSPSKAQMIQAGFFNCNVGDRVICLYCKLICQQWVPHSDDPSGIHKALSPKCPYVTTYLTGPPITSIPIVNEASVGATVLNQNAGACDQFVSADVCHPPYREIPKRYASFGSWSSENSPQVDDLVRAGFFYTGVRSVVTCFYCNGSLQNWAATDDPMIEHARWFPQCAYVKQLCGEQKYRKIQQANQRRKELQEQNRANEESSSIVGNGSSGRLVIRDEAILSRYVAARLDLPVSQRMIDRNFKQSIVKRCWEDQLRLKADDFHSDLDLFIACTVLQYQIQYIDGKKENIIIPSVTMNKLREKELMAIKPPTVDFSNNDDAEMSTSMNDETKATKPAENETEKKSDIKSDGVNSISKKTEDQSSPSNPCALCLTEEKCLAFVPCGHVAACVSCGHSVRSCPICRSEIKAFVRVYL